MTRQTDMWSGSFGRQYTVRNMHSLEEMNRKYMNYYGTSRQEMNSDFLSRIKPQRILEVGSNIGNQLLLLSKMGYQDLWGIEINDFALKKARERLKNANLVKASAFDIPFKDNHFDLVFTSGVLIHISPTEINEVLKEIHRVSNRFIWGFEYYSPRCEQVSYRGNKELLWKTDFPGLYLRNFKDLSLVKEVKYKYRNNDNIDQMFLLEKSRAP